MKKRNPIARLVKLRSIRERGARVDLAEAQKSVQFAAADLQKARERRALPEANTMLHPLELQVLQMQGFRVREIIEAAEAAYEEAYRHLGDVRHAWHSASVELDSAENLDQRRRNAAAVASRVAAERAVGELHAARRKRSRQ